jgi:ABC-type transport system involved in multi-copper enzyme maturation permease subunit/regulation of enolase protein 1 (concanavalin A-like superfamily)
MSRLLLAEWTKLRTVPRWMFTLAAVAVLTIGVTVLTAAGTIVSGGGGGDEPSDLPANHQDAGNFRYQRLTGDGSLVARVATQADSHQWAKAGLMLRADERHGAASAAIMVTPDHGVHLQSRLGDTDIAGSAAGAPRWLRLDRSGTTVTGYESADGHDWHRVGAVEIAGLTGGADLGLFVASPDEVRIDRQFGGESMTGHPTTGEATFDGIRGAAGAWQDGDRSMPPEEGRVAEDGGTVTLAGGGDVGPTLDVEDRTRTTLAGVLIGLMAVVALAVLFVTAEYKRGMILTTFAATPRRERVLAAKALVLGSATFVAGLVASFGAFLLGSALLGAKGLAMPSLGDAGVLRALVGTAALLAVVAVFSLAVATILRRSAAAITVVLLLLIVPQIIATGLPLSVAMWLSRLTPAAGFAIQETVERYDTAISPWAGFGVLCAYTAVALAVAARRLNRRDA